jgi:hypothetical protein
LLYQNGCWTDGQYNNNDYKVEAGTVTDGRDYFDAYRIYEPQRKFTNFLGSQHGIFYKFPTKENYTIYSFDGNTINKIVDVSATQIDSSKFIKINGLTVSQLTGSITYLFVPSNKKVSVFTQLSTGIEAAAIKQTSIGRLSKYRYSINGTPFDTVLDFTASPSTHQNIYSLTRQFFLVQNTTQQIGIVWQDKTNFTLQLTWLDSNLQSMSSVSLFNPNNETLAAATFDSNGHIYYLTIQTGNGSSTETARSATLFKVTTNGQKVTQRSLDTSKNGLNIVSFDDGTFKYVASLNYSNKKLGLIVARQMHKSNDGLNHQGAIGLVFDANDLTLIKNHQQTSGHSLEGSVLMTNSNGQFLGVDIGDNYPRGVNLHEFDETTRKSRVVYTFKTSHGTTSNNPAGNSFPEYAEISNSSQKYYRWSNDNKMYTELGGVVEGENGYSVIFAGEVTSDKRALDNSRTGDYLNDSRNIGLVQVVKNFQIAQYGSENIVTDDLVLSSGNAEKGGFYTFQGDWSEQRNKGVVWLTNYRDKNQENVSRLKTLSLGSGKILLVWEKWSANDYVNTYAMLVSESGTILSEAIELGKLVRLNRRDDIWFVGNKVYLIAGNKADKVLEVITLEIGSSSPPVSSNYSLTMSKSGNGSIVSNPTGINCGTDCNKSFQANTNISLTATPEKGFNFSNWSGDCSGTNTSITIKMDQNRSCKATFVASSSSDTPANGSLITSDLWIDAEIQTVEKGSIHAKWKQGGDSVTQRGDRVIWGYFYANPTDVSWGSANNPDLYVKIWFDAGGRIDVNFFHVSVPDIKVYSTKNNGDKLTGISTMDNRYVRHSYYTDKTQNSTTIDTRNATVVKADYPVGKFDNVVINSLINSVEKGGINGQIGAQGEDQTVRGDLVAWGYFYANPTDVSWGDTNNPEVFIKIWADVSGRIDVNFFHVSVPNINVSSYLIDKNYTDITTSYNSIVTMDKRYSRHEYFPK